MEISSREETHDPFAEQERRIADVTNVKRNPSVLPFSSPRRTSAPPQLTEDAHEEASQTKTVKEVSHDRFAEQERRIANRIATPTIRSETPPSRQHAHGIRDQLYNNHIQQST